LAIGISFDFWNTLYGNGDEPGRYKKRVKYFYEVVSTYKKVDYSAIENAFHASTKFFIYEWQHNFRTPTAAERIRYMADIFSIRLSHSDIEKTADYFGQLIFSIPPEKNPKNLLIVKQLSERYPLGLISDTGYISGKFIRQFLIEQNIYTNFSSLIFSDEQTYCKPHTSVFRLTCKNLDISCSNLIHIGDLEKTDMKGAKDSGGIGIKYTAWNKNSKEKSLANYLINDYQELFDIVTNIANS
jgi:putative hydrolase of the HAD superfamily